MTGQDRRTSVLVAVAGVIAMGVGSHGWQDPAKPTGIIMGQVVDGATGRPVSGVTVTLSGVPNVADANTLRLMSLVEVGLASPDEARAAGVMAPRRVMSDSQGRFLFRELPKGRFSLNSSAPGYVPGNYGQARPQGPGQQVDLEDAQKINDAKFRIWKYAVLSGTVTDETGEPALGAGVRTFRRAIVGGRARFTPGTIAATDDRGIYRLANLTPGDYIVGIVNSVSTIPVETQVAYMDALMSGSTATSPVYQSLLASGTMSATGTGFRVGDLIVQPNAAPLGRGGGGGAFNPPAPGNDGRMLVYQTQFYPGAPTSAQATVLALKSGEDRQNVDFQLRLVNTVRVSGSVTGPDGAAPNLGVRLVPTSATDLSIDLDAASTVSDATGAFTFLGVTPGQYVIRITKNPRAPAGGRGAAPVTTTITTAGGSMVSTMVSSGPGPALPPLPTDPVLWAALPLAVGDTNVTGVSVALRAGIKVAGRLEFQGSIAQPAPDQLERVTISLSPADGRSIVVSSSLGRATTNGQFTTPGYPAGRYYINALTPAPGWTLKAIISGGRDVSAEPLELEADDIAGVVITFTDKATELSGSVVAGTTGPDSTAEVMIFPADNLSWRDSGLPNRRSRTVRATKAGAFVISGLPPGDYFVVALTAESAGNWPDPKFVESVMRVATRVTLADGEKKRVDLKTAVVK
jgi:hypothetical protein